MHSAEQSSKVAASMQLKNCSDSQASLHAVSGLHPSLEHVSPVASLPVVLPPLGSPPLGSPPLGSPLGSRKVLHSGSQVSLLTQATKSSIWSELAPAQSS